MHNIRKVQPPCGKDCESRAAGCHASCMAWAEYVGKRDESYAKRIDAEAVGAALCSRAERVRKIWEKGRR